MKRLTITMGIFCLLCCASGTALAEGTYAGIKVGGFMPNGKGDTTNQGGLKDFDTGYNLELAVGFRPASYAAIEAGTGFYSASRDIAITTTSREKSTIYGVPATITAKAVLPLERSEFFVGAGAGYYFSVLQRDSTNGASSRSSSSHGNALGYHLVGGFDYNLGERYSLGAEIKWFSTKPKFDDAGGTGSQTEWEFGGTTLNLGVKYKF